MVFGVLIPPTLDPQVLPFKPPGEFVSVYSSSSFSIVLLGSLLPLLFDSFSAALSSYFYNETTFSRYLSFNFESYSSNESIFSFFNVTCSFVYSSTTSKALYFSVHTFSRSTLVFLISFSWSSISISSLEFYCISFSMSSFRSSLVLFTAFIYLSNFSYSASLSFFILMFPSRENFN